LRFGKVEKTATQLLAANSSCSNEAAEYQVGLITAWQIRLPLVADAAAARRKC
jgi:hypothetical protein